MSADKKEIMADLKFCKELMDRLYHYADKTYGSDVPRSTVIQNDIIRLRRELMNVSKKLAYDYDGYDYDGFSERA